MLTIFMGASLAAPKIDPELNARLKTLPGNSQLGVILTFQGLMEEFPAEVRQVAPGQFQALPGPRFEPSRNVKRVEFLNPATRLIALMFGE
jgi:hypothetical protein